MPGPHRLSLDGHPYQAEIIAALRWSRSFVSGAEALAMNALERGFLLAGLTAIAGCA